MYHVHDMDTLPARLTAVVHYYVVMCVLKPHTHSLTTYRIKRALYDKLLVDLNLVKSSIHTFRGDIYIYINRVLWSVYRLLFNARDQFLFHFAVFLLSLISHFNCNSYTRESVYGSKKCKCKFIIILLAGTISILFSLICSFCDRQFL